MWKDGKHIIWRHIVNLYNSDLESGLKLLPRLTNEHIKLTSYSKMKVRLAVQVLSSSVASILRKFSPEDCSETANLCSQMDTFFDCFNVRSLTECTRKRKSMLAPYRSIDDARLKILMEDVLGFFEKWRDSILKCKGGHSKDDQQKMFISNQTFVGLKTTILAVVECVRYLLSSGMPYVLTEKFNQDNAEEYFGRQRAMGRRSDNPTIYQFGYNANTIRIQRSIRTVSGNTSGKYSGLKKKSSWYNVDSGALAKRKRK
eukprot:Seg1064.2 transcript_id=Seg1064.2/GoldUCD/mRNA.D3Y31 product="Transposable element P transposase" protein_id=Seg1064.2/GoldUCD/D3Y31